MAKMVRELMHPGLITCRANATLGQVATLLTQHHIHALFVADRDGRPVGVISDFDLLAGEWLSIDAESLNTMRQMTAGELMTTPIDTVEAQTPAIDAAKRMRQEAITRLMVTEGGKPVGVISISDFVASLMGEGPVKRQAVSDVMSRAMLICREGTLISAVARVMTDAHFRSVLILDGVGQPRGVASGMDLLAFCEEGGCADATVEEVMHAALTIAPDASLREAADKMIENHHHRLVVVDPTEAESIPLGIISSFDIVAEMARPGSVWQS